MGQFGEQQSTRPIPEWAYGPNENATSWMLCRCAGGRRERERKSKGAGEIRPYGVLTTVAVPQQASSFGSSPSAVSKKTCQNNHQLSGALLYPDHMAFHMYKISTSCHIMTVLTCNQWLLHVQTRLEKNVQASAEQCTIMERKVLLILYMSLFLCWWFYKTVSCITVYVIHMEWNSTQS